MTVRILTSSDFDALAELTLSRENFLGVPEDKLEMQRAFAVANMRDLLATGNSLGAVFAYEDSAGIMQGAVITLVSTTHPCYFLNKAYTRPGASLSVLSSIFTETIKYYEELGYKRFYTMYKKELVETYHRLWKVSNCLKEYVSYTELELAPQERPKHSDFWELLSGRQLYMDAMVIRGFLKLDESATIWRNES